MEEKEEQIENVVLTKAALLSGIEDVHEVETAMGVFRIRSLTEGEKTKAEALLFKGLKALGGISNMDNLRIEGDAEQIFANESNYDFYIIMCALNLKDGKEKWSMVDVKNIKFKGQVRKELVARIEAVSDMSPFLEKVKKNIAGDKAKEFFQDPPRDRAGETDSP